MLLCFFCSRPDNQSLLNLLLFLAAVVRQPFRRRVLSRMFQQQPLWVGRCRSWILKIIISPRSHPAWLARSCPSRSSLCRRRHRRAPQLWVLTRRAARAPLPSFLQRARRHTSGRTARRSSTPFSARAALSRSSGKSSLFWHGAIWARPALPERVLIVHQKILSLSQLFYHFSHLNSTSKFIREVYKLASN